MLIYENWLLRWFNKICSVRFHEAMQSMYHRHIEATLCVCIAKTQVTQFRNFPNISTTTGDREDPIGVPEVGL